MLQYGFYITCITALYPNILYVYTSVWSVIIKNLHTVTYCHTYKLNLLIYHSSLQH